MHAHKLRFHEIIHVAKGKLNIVVWRADFRSMLGPVGRTDLSEDFLGLNFTVVWLRVDYDCGVVLDSQICSMLTVGGKKIVVGLPITFLSKAALDAFIDLLYIDIEVSHHSFSALIFNFAEMT